MQAAMGRLVAILGLVGMAGCGAEGGYSPGYASPSYGGGFGYDAPVYRSYEPRRSYYEPEYGRGYNSGGGYRRERQFEERRQPEREERRAAPPRQEERRPGPGIRAPFDRSSSSAPRYSGPADPRRLLEIGGQEGGR